MCVRGRWGEWRDDLSWDPVANYPIKNRQCNRNKSEIIDDVDQLLFQYKLVAQLKRSRVMISHTSEVWSGFPLRVLLLAS